MLHIISGTNRPGSRSLEVSRILQSLYKAEGVDVGLIDLAELGSHAITGADYGSQSLPPKVREAIDQVTASDGLIVVCPEYNGSMPGALKYFIDFWKYPDTFEYRPVAFVGLGGRFGGLRPVEHLQQVFGYRNAFCFPARVFLTDVHKQIKDGEVQNPLIQELLVSQTRGFIKFVRALQSESLDANSVLKSRAMPT